MKTITKSYPIVCPSCHGSGIIPAVMTGTSVTTLCPACNGGGVITCTEIHQDDVSEITDKTE